MQVGLGPIPYNPYINLLISIKAWWMICWRFKIYILPSFYNTRGTFYALVIIINPQMSSDIGRILYWCWIDLIQISLVVLVPVFSNHLFLSPREIERSIKVSILDSYFIMSPKISKRLKSNHRLAYSDFVRSSSLMLCLYLKRL